MQQGKPLGLAKNARGGICPAGRDCTFGGMPTGQAASEVLQKLLYGKGLYKQFLGRRRPKLLLFLGR